ncbi:hypothetical protein NF677_03620 [Pseudomonas siliginis]|uniref:Uncharacterized protein n=1 Tax=Pseudomonas siliginis TaxID=2842346 RepID=A0ABY5CHN2_9PSED|nr:hypothetical protein [Pseudomonas siliginis]UST85779.1 hypothetical protein NF677_03620 [Pseudomonas siliginis]
MANLQMEVSVEGFEDLVRPLLETMQSLEHFPELPLQIFRDLVAHSLHDIAVSFDGAALAAGDLRGVCRPSRNLELVTAALLALNAYLHR